MLKDLLGLNGMQFSLFKTKLKCGFYRIRRKVSYRNLIESIEKIYKDKNKAFAVERLQREIRKQIEEKAEKDKRNNIITSRLAH